MKEFNRIRDIGDFPEVRKHLLSVSDREVLGQTFEDYFGGQVFVVESIQDLHQIPTGFQPGEVDKDPGHLGLVDGFLPLSSTPYNYDMCEVIDNYTVILLITNNAGGPVWYVPNEIARHSENIERSIELCKGEVSGNIKKL